MLNVLLSGWSCLHSIVNIALAYCVLKIGGPRIVTVILMFLLNVVSVSFMQVVAKCHECPGSL